MARVTGTGIDPKGAYEATELVGRGMYRLQRVKPPEAAPKGFATVKISLTAMQKIGRYKLPGETLAAAVERLALSSLDSKVAQSASSSPYE